MGIYRAARDCFEAVPASVTMHAAGLANEITGIEAYRHIPFQDLPSHLVEQLRSDGMRDGARRSLAEAQELFEQRVPSDPPIATAEI